MHRVIFVPGLGDNEFWLNFIVDVWKKEGISVTIHMVPWKAYDELFQPKLERLIQKIDKETSDGQKISLIGTSAGGSLIINAFRKRKEKIHRIITISSRLLKGTKVFPPLTLGTKFYPAFVESVLKCEDILTTLNEKDKGKILTTQSHFFDEMVPLSTMSIPGVKKYSVPVPFHVLSIAFTVTLYRKRLITFLESS